MAWLAARIIKLILALGQGLPGCLARGMAAPYCLYRSVCTGGRRCASTDAPLRALAQRRAFCCIKTQALPLAAKHGTLDFVPPCTAVAYVETG